MVKRLHETPIAVIGMASVMPDAHNLREFWDNIVRKADCIQDVPESRWNIDDYYDPDPTAPDKTYCKRGGFLPEIDFDPMEFGLPPNILEVTDVSQMISLVVARDAMIDAGYGNADATVRDRTGVVLGVGGGQKLITPLTSRLQYPVWERALKSAGLSDSDQSMVIEKIKSAYIRWEENSFPGMLGNVIAGRIANRLDLGGMNCVVDAACASSMGAMKMAVSDLVEGRSDMMITGGVDTDNSIFMYMCFSKTPAFTQGDQPRPFDEQSDGMMVGEGIGMMVFKRLEDAERDGDRIYAVIRGIGASSDGRYKSIYAPRGEGQERALDRAYEDANIAPETVSLIEAHGTGTKAGDSEEVTTLVRFFNKHTEKRDIVALGSVKSQIGHTKAAAGVAGMIKASLAIHHKVLPATVNVENPNPKLGLDDSAVYVNTETRPWISDGVPRRAGVSSFGFGGTNYHFILEEYTGDHKEAYRLHNVADMVLFSAETPNALLTQVQNTLAQLQGDDANTHYLNLLQASRDIKIDASHARVGFVSNTLEDTIPMLEATIKLLQSKADAEEWQHPKGISYRRSALDLKGKVVALFSGQGSQYAYMGSELALNFPAIRESYQQIDTLFAQDGLRKVSDVVYPAPVFTQEEKDAQAQMIQRTDYVQPAIGAFSAGLFNLLKSAGFRPDFVAGHSFGELTALWASGVLNDQDYYALVKARGLAMAPPADPNFDAGTMMAVTGDVSNLAQDVASLDGVHMANINSPKQVVLAGAKDALNNAKPILEGKGYNVVPLPVSAAFHTPLVGHAQRPFAEAIKNATFGKAQIPVYSNANGQAYPEDTDAIRQTLSEHILQSVHFSQEIENLHNAGGYLFIEFGPRNVLTNLVKDILHGKPHMAIALNGSRKKGSDRQFREAMVKLQVLGLQLGNIDPYHIDAGQAPEDAKPRRKGMRVKVSGGPYVSDKTQQAYKDILVDGRTISGGGVREVIKEVPVEVVKEVEVVREVVKEVPTASTSTSAPAPSIPNAQDGMAKFSQHQAEVLKAHEQYLANQAEYIKVFNQLAQQQGQILANGVSAESVQSLQQSMDTFHTHQAETLRVHEDYLRQQSDYTQSLLEMMRQQYHQIGNGNGAISTPVAPVPATPVTTSPVETPKVASPEAVAPKVASPAPAPESQPTPTPILASAPSTAGVNVEMLSEAMLDIVSDKTGYPVDMLELDMDIEADLGIDSIKRVEILGTMREQFPSLPQLKPEELAELRTLGEIVEYMGANSGSAGASNGTTSTPVPNTTTETLPATPAPAPTPVDTQEDTVIAKVASGLSLEVLSEAMLQIVSDKTGYPVDMLELDMDIEADLGIDSIKRVEILGTMREQFPSLPQLKPEELAELRTLGEIVEYMGANAGGGDNTPTPTPPAPTSVPVAETTPAVAETPAPVATESASTGGISLEVLSEAMLQIVSDKTGYPVDMLELDMDIEADLGIDSIKRVEILGTMREQFPSLPQLKPEELAELRTLGEIVEYMGANAGGGDNTPTPTPPAPTSAPVAEATPAVAETPAPVATESASTGGISLEVLSEAMLQIVSDKTGYPVDMLELDMDIEADLGIDSIKRVEILGTMREQFPSLPQLKPEELAELRTLGEIVEYMGANAGGGDNTPTPTPPAPTSAPVAEATPAVAETPAPVATESASTGGISLEVLSEAMLQIVSDKTGYPVDMLELDMDIEADLGIDSIKRVEILGTMREQFPSLPQLKPEELAELRTLGEIVEYMSNNTDNGASNGHTNGASNGTTNGTAPKVTANGTSKNGRTVTTLAQGIPYSPAELKFLPEPDLMTVALSGVFIVTDDGTSLTQNVADGLQQKGATVVVLNFPADLIPTQGTLSAGITRVSLADTTEKGLESALDTITAQHGQISGLIHLNPTSQTGELFVEQEKAILKLVFLLAKHLKKPLNASAETHFSAFMTVARLDGAFGTASGASSAIAGGLFGLTKSVNLEWNNVFCRALDIAYSLDAPQASAIILEELQDPNRLLVEVARTGTDRVTLTAGATAATI